MSRNLAPVFVSPLLLKIDSLLCMVKTLMRKFMGFVWKFCLKRLVELEGMLLCCSSYSNGLNSQPLPFQKNRIDTLLLQMPTQVMLEW